MTPRGDSFGSQVSKSCRTISVGVAAVDMQQVDASIGELPGGVVERGPQKAREAVVTRVMEGGKVGVDLLGIEPGLRVAFPGIDRDTLRRHPAQPHRFAERGVRDAVMGAEFDEGARPQRLDQPKGEWDMTIPCAYDAGIGARQRRGRLERNRSAGRGRRIAGLAPGGQDWVTVCGRAGLAKLGVATQPLLKATSPPSASAS